MIGAGSFGTALAVLLSRGGVRTTLQTRTDAQAAELAERRVNEEYLPGVELPPPLRIETVSSGVQRADLRRRQRDLDCGHDVLLCLDLTALGQ